MGETLRAGVGFRFSWASLRSSWVCLPPSEAPTASCHLSPWLIQDASDKSPGPKPPLQPLDRHVRCDRAEVWGLGRGHKEFSMALNLTKAPTRTSQCITSPLRSFANAPWQWLVGDLGGEMSLQEPYWVLKVGVWCVLPLKFG